MPNSISSFRVIPGDGPGYLASVNRAGTLSELIELVPAPFRPRTQELVNKVYRAAIKSNHARGYLSTLEKHQQDGTFPPEIAGRVHPPSIQISKEFSASAECKSSLAGLDNSTFAHKKALLSSAIDIKTREVSYLQKLFSEEEYKEDADAIFTEVTGSLGENAGLAPGPDGSVQLAGAPAWMKDDCILFQNTRLLFPQRAIALAYSAVQLEMSKKFKSLSLKRKVVEDIEMQDAVSATDTVQALITKNMEQLRKELQKTNPGNGKSRKTIKTNPRNSKPPGQRTQKVAKSKQGKGKGKGGKKPPGKPRN